MGNEYYTMKPGFLKPNRASIARLTSDSFPAWFRSGICSTMHANNLTLPLVSNYPVKLRPRPGRLIGWTEK